MDYAFLAFVFLCIALGLGTFQSLSSSGRSWAAILTLILFILIFVFFGQRWFRDTKTTASYTGSWPPIINMCPDYLVYFKKGNQDTCIDVIGVSRNSDVLKPWSKDDTPQSPPSDTAKYFPFVYKPNMTPEQLQNLCTKAMDNGLTWEGITNGESCTFGA